MLLSNLSKFGICRWCNQQTEWVLKKQFFQNGSINFVRSCAGCGRLNPGTGLLYIPGHIVREHATEEQIEALPAIVQPPFNRCAVCGRRDTELHHWAPKAIFGPETANDWPQDYLCVGCHDIWHLAVTPGLVK